MPVAVSYQLSAINVVSVTPATSVLVDMAPNVNGYVVTLTNGTQHQSKTYFGVNGADDLGGTTPLVAGKDPHIAQFHDPHIKPYFNPLW